MNWLKLCGWSQVDETVEHSIVIIFEIVPALITRLGPLVTLRVWARATLVVNSFLVNRPLSTSEIVRMSRRTRCWTIWCVALYLVGRRARARRLLATWRRASTTKRVSYSPGENIRELEKVSTIRRIYALYPITDDSIPLVEGENQDVALLLELLLPLFELLLELLAEVLGPAEAELLPFSVFWNENKDYARWIKSLSQPSYRLIIQRFPANGACSM